jgi:hypothetical protein
MPNLWCGEGADQTNGCTVVPSVLSMNKQVGGMANKYIRSRRLESDSRTAIAFLRSKHQMPRHDGQAQSGELQTGKWVAVGGIQTETT